MKNLFTAVILGITLAGVSFAQTAAGKGAEVKAAVVEFSAVADASGMPADAKRQLQTGLAAALAKSNKLDIADVRHTRTASADNLADINGSSTAAAVKLGKKLDVRYVLTGTVVEYAPKGEDNFGRVVVKIRLIEVATGKVKHTDEVTQRSTGAMYTSGIAEMHAKTVMPAVKKLAATILELSF